MQNNAVFRQQFPQPYDAMQIPPWRGAWLTCKSLPRALTIAEELLATQRKWFKVSSNQFLTHKKCVLTLSPTLLCLVRANEKGVTVGQLMLQHGNRMITFTEPDRVHYNVIYSRQSQHGL